MPTDVKETITRKLGPLPVWGWAIAVAGAVFIARKLRGGASGSGSPVVTAGEPQIIGDGGDTSGLATQIAALEARLETSADASDILALQEQLDNATGTIGNLSQYQTLSTQLTTKLQQYSAALASVERYRTLKRTAPTDAKRREYDALMDKSQAQANTLLADITKLREQISKIGAS